MLGEEATATQRLVSPELETMMNQPIKVLDHGFVRLVDYMGNDASIVQAARVSYGKGTKRQSDDRNLIFYLMRHWHTTPFEMCEIKLHVKMPLFVARQWVRHRTSSINEYSARYSVLSKEFYMPEPQHMAPQSATNHQGRADNTLPPEQVRALLTLLRRDSLQCYDTYMAHMNMTEDGEEAQEGRAGLSRELARMNLTLNYYTEMYWKVNLHNLFHFLRLRGDNHAQYEIRVYAHVIQRLVEAWVPVAAEAFKEYRQDSCAFSKTGMDVVRRLVRGEDVRRDETGMSKREWGEVLEALHLPQGDVAKVA